MAWLSLSFDLVFLLKPLYELIADNSSIKIDPVIKDGVAVA